ncbi:MAG: hypothetical protein ABI466_02915, partial [Chloroflexota bacterium]
MRIGRTLARTLTLSFVLAGCTPIGSTLASPTVAATASPTVAVTTAAPTPTASPQPTPTPRPEPPPIAADPVAIAVQVSTAERAVRDLGVTGAELAWMG